jgi:uncharacterized protein GlcG (DUF336 family)
MRRIFIAAVLVACATAHAASRIRAVRPPSLPAPPQMTALEPPGCAVPPATPATCDEGSGPFASLSATEVDTIARAAAKSIGDAATIAVVDRAGRILGVLRKAGVSTANDDLAVAVARTAAFFSHNMAPLSSRTVRFISGIHFPPGISNTGSAALYGIENTNRGCDFNVAFNPPSQCVPRARKIGGGPCQPGLTSGCGLGIVTGKIQPDDVDPASVSPGGVPLYRSGQLVGAVGVVGTPFAEFAAASAAFAAAGIAPVPSYPLPAPGNVFVDGIRLPFLGSDIRLDFNSNGQPIGIKRVNGTNAGTDTGAVYTVNPSSGGCAANGYLVGPLAGTGLSMNEVDAVVQRAITTAKRTRALIRLPLNSYARMVIAVADPADGSILALYRMPDATVFSIDVAVAKARNVIWFSGHDLPVPAGTAVTNRTINFGAQPFYPPGIDSSVFDPKPGPWFQSLFVRDLNNPCTQGTQPLNANQNGIVFFAGSSPLYRNSALAGGLGVSGDGIEQDDYVTYHGAGELLPPQSIWADQVNVDGARLPMFKFPRQPEGVTECGGKPCS